MGQAGTKENHKMNLELLKENRSQGWASAESAPEWAKARICEIRTAQAAKVTPPAPSREYIAAAEQRSVAALTLVNRLFPTRGRPTIIAKLTPRQEMAKRNGLTEGQIIDAEFRLQAKRQAVEIAAEQPGVSDEQEVIRMIRQRDFPWERQR
jgi:hypothetical protein